MKYKILEDIAQADIAYEAYGESIEELFESSALALFEIMVDTASVRKQKNFQFSIFNSQLEDLLFEFLEELVFLKDAKNMLFSKFDVSIVLPSEESLRTPRRRNAFKSYKLTAKCWGEEINCEKHKIRLDVKAVTMHKFFVKKKRDGYVAQVVLDI